MPPVRLVKSDTFYPDRPIMIPDERLETLAGQYLELADGVPANCLPTFEGWLEGMGY